MKLAEDKLSEKPVSRVKKNQKHQYKNNYTEMNEKTVFVLYLFSDSKSLNYQLKVYQNNHCCRDSELTQSLCNQCLNTIKSVQNKLFLLIYLQKRKDYKRYYILGKYHRDLIIICRFLVL